MSELPTEIIVDILSRLAVEPLLRFRCVSKPWCSLIDSPIFVKTHLNRSIENHTNLTLILRECRNKHTLYSLDFHSFETPIAFIKPFKNYFLLGSCNGLLLLEGECDQLVLFNPSTRHYRNLPTNTIGGVNLLVEKYGLGYDSFADDYKVIRVVYFYESHKSYKTQAEVYNLKSNSWRKIRDFPYWIRCVGDNGWGAHVNDALHMVVTECSGIDSPKLIVAFGARDENFYTVPKPNFPNNEYDYMNVGVLGRFLCTMCTYRGYRTDLWVMRDYGMKESWTKLLSNFTQYTFCDPLKVLCYLKSRDKILLNYDNQKLLWYDLKKRTACIARVRGLPNYFYSEVCVRSLVPLYGYGELVNPGRNTKQKNDKRRTHTLQCSC